MDTLRHGELPHLLFLCQTLPFPPDGGANIRTNNVLRLLSRDFRITALCFYRRAAVATAEIDASIRALRPWAQVEAFPIPQEHSRTRFVVDHLESLLTRRVYTVAAHRSGSYRNRIRELLHTERFALAHMDSLDLSAYLPLLSTLRTVVVHHNIESTLLRQRAHAEASAFKRWYLRLQSALMEAEERRWTASVAMNVTVSEDDSRILQRMVPAARLAVVPNGVDTSTFRPGDATEKSLVFVGGHDWFPNRDALDYFCAEILPLVRQRHPDIAVHWVGRAPADVRAAALRNHGVQMTGYVDDIRPLVQRAACYVVPLRLGGGTRLKILDAWAMGKAVVSTSLGCEGLNARDGENLLVRDTPELFADAIHSVLADPGLRSTLEQGARSTAVERYDWEVIGRHMLAIYRRLASNGP